MATKEFKLPDVGEGVAEGELVSWLVEPGDAVTEDQPVAEVETDKALVEVPSPYDGTVKELLAEEGEMVPVGQVIITFSVGEADDEATEGEPEAETESVPEAEAAEPEAETESDSGRVFAPPSVRRLARELGVRLDAVAGSGPGGRITEGDVRAAAEGEDEADSEADAEDEAGGPRSVDVGGKSAVSKRDDGAAERKPADAAGRDRTLAAPATRRLAEEAGVDVDDVPAAESRDGESFVDEAAVREYAAAQRAAQAADAEAVGADAEAPDVGESDPEDVEADEESVGEVGGPSAGERIPYRGVRRTIGEQMKRSKYTAPHVTHFDDADVTELVELREELKSVAEERGSKLSFMPFVMKAIAAALKQYPYMNATLDEEAEEILLRDEYHIGVATATDIGLMVPVVRDVDRRGLLDVADEMNEKVQKARDRSISMDEMRGGTFTVTNVGVVGGDYGTPIINYPEVAIMALGAIEQRPRVVDGEVVPRHTLPLSLSFDHRVADGALAAEFTNTVIEYLEEPKLLLLE